MLRQARLVNVVAGAFLTATLTAPSGCRPAPRPGFSIDLVANAFRADVEVERLGVNLLRPHGDADLATGWGVIEEVPALGFAAWTMGSRATITFHLNRVRPLTLSVSAAPLSYDGRPEPLAGLHVNGRPLLPLILSDAPGALLVVALPAEVLRVGRNEIVFVQPWARVPKELGTGPDLRRLGAHFKAIYLRDPAHDARGGAREEPGPRVEFQNEWTRWHTDPQTLPYRWLLGTRGTIEFDVGGIPVDLRATGSLMPYQPRGLPAHRIEWVLNGVVVDARTLAAPQETAWSPLSLTLPRRHLKPGRNRLELHADYSARPVDHHASADARPLSVAVQGLQLRPDPISGSGQDLVVANTLIQPAGTTLSYTLPVPPAGRLALAGEATAPLTLSVLTTCADETRELYHRRVSGRVNLEWPLSCPAGELGRIQLLVDGDSRTRDTTLRYTRLELHAGHRWDPWRDQAPDPPSTSPGTPPRTILIHLVDTLRADRVRPSQNAPAIPNLSSFMKRAQRFSNAWSVTSWTKPAVASILTGLPPERHGAETELSTLGAGVPWLPELLKQAGYRTEAVVASCFADPAFGFARGFDAYDYRCSEEETPRAFVTDGVRKALSRAAGERVFLYVHTNEPHTPYTPPPLAGGGRGAPDLAARQRRLMDETEFALNRQRRPGPAVDQLRSLYDREVTEADTTFGALLALLAEQGRGSDALIVFVSDHGEEFAEHGGLEHAETLFPEVTQIPLLVQWPDGRRAGTDDTLPATQLDILPTILSAAGLPTGGHPGEALGVPSPDRVLPLSLLFGGRDEAGVRYGRFLYTRAAERVSGQYLGQPLEYVFDLATDPAATRNLAAALPLETAYLRALSRSRRSAGELPGAAALDDETLARLKALGYLR